MRVDRQSGVMALLGGLVSILPVMIIVWTVLRPFVTDSISVALADDITSTVQRELAPVKGGFEVLLMQQIIQSQKAIALLERRGLTNLTPEETTQLVDLRAQLAAQQSALAELRK